MHWAIQYGVDVEKTGSDTEVLIMYSFGCYSLLMGVYNVCVFMFVSFLNIKILQYIKQQIWVCKEDVDVIEDYMTGTGSLER